MSSWSLLKKRKLVLILLFVIIALGLQAKMITGHAPARFWLAYDFATETLSIDIEHPRSYPDIHYIDNVVIWKNDVVIRNETYTSQLDDNYHLYFVINASHMDEFRGYGHCIIGGNATDTVTVINRYSNGYRSGCTYSNNFRFYIGIHNAISYTEYWNNSTNSSYKKQIQ
ncbi:MAG: hypothetical protein ACTSPM_07195 [Candidatus Heimdallarchaeota archaeon]